MGNILSTTSTRESITHTEDNIRENQIMEDIIDPNKNNSVELQDNESDDEIRAKKKEEEMNEFRKQLNIKREQRKEILSRHRREKEELEKSLQSEILLKLQLEEQNKVLRELLFENNINIPQELSSNENSEMVKAILQMKEEAENLKSMNNKLRCELASTNNSLQSAYSDLADLSAQNTESMKQITSLKEVITVSKTMIHLREEQLNQLKNKLNEIEQSLADRESHMLSTDLRQEYERQLQNIRTLRGLYEERARLAEVSRQTLTRDLQEQKEVNQSQAKKISDLNAKISELETTVSALQEAIDEKNNHISLSQKETHGLKSEMEVVNKLFSQVLLGYKTKQDLDKLVNRLEQNHGILTQMAERENGSEASTVLPKMLLQLVSQVEETEQSDSEQTNDEEIDSGSINKNEEGTDVQNGGNATAEEIVQNLPKVWRVLMELLSHQSVPETNDDSNYGPVTTCYKSVDTKSGPVLVPSVSQTYIRLKDLIIEKLTLIKEVNRMKQLNGHLETRLQEQERRLCMVTTELSKTWHVVGRLRRHHHQLHTHEKILKYELQQKRKLLNELKEELEYCREKWEQARQKNSQSEKDWKKLREEFSSRKLKSASMSLNNSAESGYSDERPSDDSSESNDECEFVKEPQIRCKKKLKKASETILDSSADCNLAAEREDPASDMLDVADLPLDIQEPIETSDTSSSDPVHKHENACIETEDEIGDMSNNSCVDEHSIAEEFSETIPSTEENKHSKTINTESGIKETCTVNSSSEEAPGTELVIDPKEILNSFKEQNKRLAKKDKKLEKMEKDSTALLEKPQNISKMSNEINSTLTNLLNRPTSSKHLQENKANNEDCEEKRKNNTQSNLQLEKDNVSKENKTSLILEQANQSQISESCENIANGTSSSAEPIGDEQKRASQESSVDLKTVLENIRRQNEHLALKDKRLQNLESGCSSVVNSITNTIATGNDMLNKLDTLHEEFTTADNVNNPSTSSSSGKCKTELKATEDKAEPSVSNDIDHEAIFAARDMRLKRLEEQTKSLVTKVNKTATKGVKINYKLEELQTIYASESSRAATPSEESEEKPQQSGTDKENK